MSMESRVFVFYEEIGSIGAKTMISETRRFDLLLTVSEQFVATSSAFIYALAEEIKNSYEMIDGNRNGLGTTLPLPAQKSEGGRLFGNINQMTINVVMPFIELLLFEKNDVGWID